jgi:flagellar L-ring protein precursor FlgH
MRLSLAALLVVTLPLAACGTISETVNGPSLSAMAYPAPLMPSEQVVLDPAQVRAAASANSLWRVGARAFFQDQRASKVGDILTVNVDIRDNARLSNETATSRESSVDAGVSSLFGLESNLARILPGSPDPAHLVTSGSTSNMAGTGSVNRSETLSMTIAAVVTSVLPNGNLVIQGRQEMRVNQELRELTVAGIVRPEDITATNTVRHTQIAEARVSYGGRGMVSRVQRVPAGQALVERFSPF